MFIAYRPLSQTKRMYDGSRMPCVVDFGGARDNDRPRGIIKGKLSLTSEELMATFDDVIKRITDSCLALLGKHTFKACKFDVLFGH